MSNEQFAELLKNKIIEAIDVIVEMDKRINAEEKERSSRDEEIKEKVDAFFDCEIEFIEERLE